MNTEKKILTEAQRWGLFLLDIGIFSTAIIVGLFARNVGLECMVIPVVLTTMVRGPYNIYKMSHPTDERGL